MDLTLVSRKREMDTFKRNIFRIDPAFAGPIKKLPSCAFGLEKSAYTNYQALVRAVIAQQVSVAAARTIGTRLRAICRGSITPSKVGELSLEELQSIGLTSAKVRSIYEITQATLSGKLKLKRFVYMDDEEIISELISLFGIGRWTAEMLLILQLGRLDVWPIDDLAVRRGWDVIHKNTEPTKARDLDRFGDPFVGMRSVVAWYCWRAS
jgi:DNA-3-methyladenine glycosylase II